MISIARESRKESRRESLRGCEIAERQMGGACVARLEDLIWWARAGCLGAAGLFCGIDFRLGLVFVGCTLLAGGVL